MPSLFPDEVLEHVLVFLTGHKDRNSVSLVCKAWCRAEGWSRRDVFIGNCYASSPTILLRRFPKLTSLAMKGRPRFTDFGLVPSSWGAFIQPWIEALADHYNGLECLRLKRMTVSDESLRIVALAFPNFRSLRLSSCDGFTTDGLEWITRHCRHLTELDLQENEIQVRGVGWLTAFPETQTSLESLNFANIHTPLDEYDFHSLYALVTRCPKLTKLKLNREITLEQMQRLLLQAPQLEDLGTGAYNQNLTWGRLHELQSSFRRVRNIRTLSGFWDTVPMCLPTCFPICKELITLDLSTVALTPADFTKFITNCVNIQRLLVQDSGRPGFVLRRTVL